TYLPSFPTRRSSDLEPTSLSNNGPVFLLHKALIILQLGSPTRERDVFLFAKSHHFLVDAPLLRYLYPVLLWGKEKGFARVGKQRSEEHTSELQSRSD